MNRGRYFGCGTTLSYCPKAVSFFTEFRPFRSPIAEMLDLVNTSLNNHVS